jgi:hypothetical protein
LGVRGGVGFLAPLLFGLGAAVIIFGTTMLVMTRQGVPQRNPLRLAWVIVSVAGLAVVKLVLALNLFPRLIGGQTLLDDTRPVFALDRVQGDRAGIESHLSQLTELVVIGARGRRRWPVFGATCRRTHLT